MRFYLSLTVAALLSALPTAGTAIPLDEPHADRGDAPKPVGIVMSGGNPATAFHGPAVDSFFADVLSVPAAVLMSCPACADPVSATPEPTSLLITGTALAGIGLILRRRLRRTGLHNRT